MPDIIYILFLFALGSCIGSFLNVVVWRLPQVEGIEDESLIAGFWRTMQALSEPPSHCPKCKNLLKWYDNIPVFGWLKLGGKCRFCRSPISKRYPIIEAITGFMFVGYYVAFFMLRIGPCVHLHSTGIYFHVQMSLVNYAWLYGLDMALLAGLLAASLIDAEFFIIPIEIPWIIAPVAVVIHAWFDHRNGPGSTDVGALPAALAVGAAVGCMISFILMKYEILPRSFAEGAPLMEVEREAFEEHRKQERKNAMESGKSTKNASASSELFKEEREWSPPEIRREIRKEMLFLLIPLSLGFLCVFLAWKVEPIAKWWEPIARQNWVSTMLGSVLGGLVGGFTVWITRILGSYGFGREAMGMGDVDLMVAVGAVLGAGPAVAAFFLAPFFGIAVALYLWIFRRKERTPLRPLLEFSHRLRHALLLSDRRVFHAGTLKPGLVAGSTLRRVDLCRVGVLARRRAERWVELGGEDIRVCPNPRVRAFLPAERFELACGGHECPPLANLRQARMPTPPLSSGGPKSMGKPAAAGYGNSNWKQAFSGKPIMGKFWMKVWIWTKVIVFSLIFIYILAFALENNQPAEIWFSYHKTIHMPTLVLALVAFVAGIICTILIRTIMVTLRQIREVKERNRHDKLHRDVEDMKAKASLLQPKAPGEKTSET